MADSAGAAAITAGGGEGGGEGGGDGQQQQQQQTSWLEQLPEPMRAMEPLTRFASVEALAQGFLDSKAALSSRAIMPATDAAPEVWGQFYTQLGRPAEAKDYDLKVPQGEPATLADAFRPVAFDAGLTAKQASAVADFWNGQQAAARTADEATLAAFKAEKGAAYPQVEQAAIGAFKTMGLDAEFAEGVAKLTSSGALIKGFAKIAELIGEHGRKDPGDAQDGMTGVPDSQAEAKLTELQKDPEWIAKLLTRKDPQTRAQYDRLLMQAQRHAQKQIGG